MGSRIFPYANFLILLAFPLGVCADPLIEVAPLDYDFGYVQVGSASSTIITISNVDGSELNIYGVVLEGSADFSITLAPDPVVGSGMTTGVEVAFTPSATGDASAVLEIASSDVDNPIVAVWLGGTGVADEPPPSATVADILAFFDTSVAVGTLSGSGSGKSADGRRRALRNMIEAAGDLIEDGAIEDACRQLLDAYERCDGLPRPPDFVSGPASSELADMILDLIFWLGWSPSCSGCR